MNTGSRSTLGPNDLFAYWEGVLTNWQLIAATGARLAQASAAAGSVVTARGEIIRDAIASPGTADYAELSRMAPEKAAAFGQATSVLLRAWIGMQATWWDQAKAASRLVAAGRAPTATEIANLWTSAALATLGHVEAGARAGRDAVEPVASAVVSNARRLRRRRPV